MIVPTEHPCFVKDTSSGALLNTNREELEALKAQRDRINKQNNEMKSLQDEVAELKQLITGLLNG